MSVATHVSFTADDIDVSLGGTEPLVPSVDGSYIVRLTADRRVVAYLTHDEICRFADALRDRADEIGAAS